MLTLLELDYYKHSMSDQKLNLHKLEKCFIIAEIGQNHQGNIQLAKDMIKIAKVRLL